MKNYAYLKKVIMNLTCIVLLLTLFSSMAFSSASKGQGIKSVNISLHLTNTNLQTLINKIEDQTDYSFFYEEETADQKDYVVTVKIEDGTVYDVLSEVSNQTGLAFRQVNNTIAIRKYEEVFEDPVEIGDIQQQKRITGKVTDTAGEPLTGATVIIKGTTKGTTTNAKGEFSLSVPLNAKSLVFTFIGFEKKEVEIGSKTNFRIKLQADITDLEEVVVKGYRASLKKASEIKRQSNQVVDAISAEDIGKMPDPNIADALQRITGVQLTRQDNEGREVSVRGLSSFFTKVTVNGIGVGPGAAADDSDGLDVGLLGADLASAIEVFKSPTAKQIEGGVGGTVNIRSRRPLEMKDGKLISGRVRANYESLQGDVTPDGSIQLGKTFGDKFGVIFGFQGSKRKYRRDAYHDDRSGGYRNDMDFNGDGIDDFYPEKSRTRYNDRENKTLSYNLSLQWRPTEDLNLYFDGTVSDKDKFRQYGQTEIRWRDMRSSNVSAVVDENNTVVEAEYDELMVRSRNSVRNDLEDLDIYNFGFDYAFNLDFRASGSLSFTKNEVQEFTQGDAELRSEIPLEAGQTFGYRLNGGDAGFSFINSGGIDINNPIYYDINGPYYDRHSFSPGGSFDLYDHKQTAAQLDFTYDLHGLFTGIDFGLRYIDRDESRNRPGHIFTGDLEEMRFVFENMISTPSNYGDLLDIDGFGQFVIPDSYAGYKYAIENGLVEPATDRVDRLFEDNYDTRTKSWAAYVQTNLKGKLFGRPFRGNIGVRVVGTDFTTTGVTAVNEGDDDQGVFEREAVTATNKYTRALPSANIAWELNDKMVARIAVARVMKRPRPEDTRAAYGINDIEYDLTTGEILSEGPYESVNGNPDLDPFTADQIDFSLEYYTKSDGAFSAGVFYKDVKDLTAFGTEEEVKSVVVRNPITLEDEIVEARVTSPINLDGTVKGFELSAYQIFSFLPKPLDGLGVQGNFTYTDAEDEEGNVIGGTSEKVYNAILFYEREKYTLRLAYNFRDYFNESPDRGATIELPNGSFARGGRWTDVNKRLDVSLSVNITKNLSFTAEGINITNEANRSYLDGIPNRLNQYEQNGTRWLAGLKFKF